MIHYDKLVDAQKLYEEDGFVNIEVPWRVSKEISAITLPDDAHAMVVDDEKVLIGSGEQGFLYLWAKGFLPYGRYQTTTPCFRSDEHGILHQKQFMKVELFQVAHSKEQAAEILENLMDTVRANTINLIRIYYGDTVMDNTELSDLKYMHLANRCEVPGQHAYDLQVNRYNGNEPIEIGSYGVRRWEHGYWVYGTAIAEPRFSTAMGSVINA